MPREKQSSSRTIHAQIKVNAAEEAALVALGGGERNAGLRRLVDQHMAAQSKHTSAPPSMGSVRHRHRRAEFVRTEYEQGTEVKVYRCDCGQEMR